MSIRVSELNPKNHTLTEEQHFNLCILHFKMNCLRRAYGKPMYVSSGVRSFAEHRAIYHIKGISDPPLGSLHLVAGACDFYDRDGAIKNFLDKNKKLVEQLDLYIEDFRYTPTWVHVQIYAPRSGNRHFIP